MTKMKQSLVLSVLLMFLSSPPIHARDKSHPAHSPAPGPSNSNCSDIIYEMMSCLSYLTPGSNDTIPVKPCCDGIEAVLKYNPQCICTGLKTSEEMGITLNNTRALAIPKTCKIPIAPPHCPTTPGASTPVISPVSPSIITPTSSPPSPPSPATSPSSAESPGSTASSPSSSGINNLLIPTFSLVATFVSFVACISHFTC